VQSHPGCQAPTDRSEEPEKDLADVFKLHAQGRTRVARETRRLNQANEAFEEVESGQVKARLVFDLR